MVPNARQDLPRPIDASEPSARLAPLGSRSFNGSQQGERGRDRGQVREGLRPAFEEVISKCVMVGGQPGRVMPGVGRLAATWDPDDRFVSSPREEYPVGVADKQPLAGLRDRLPGLAMEAARELCPGAAHEIAAPGKAHEVQLQALAIILRGKSFERVTAADIRPALEEPRSDVGHLNAKSIGAKAAGAGGSHQAGAALSAREEAQARTHGIEVARHEERHTGGCRGDGVGLRGLAGEHGVHP